LAGARLSPSVRYLSRAETVPSPPFKLRPDAAHTHPPALFCAQLPQLVQPLQADVASSTASSSIHAKLLTSTSSSSSHHCRWPSCASSIHISAHAILSAYLSILVRTQPQLALPAARHPASAPFSPSLPFPSLSSPSFLPPIYKPAYLSFFGCHQASKSCSRFSDT
jgi:hypothetical protein